MFKKFLAAVLLLIIVFATMMPINVFAEEYNVIINCSAVQSEASGKQLEVYFKNIETGEEISRKITTVGVNKFNDFPSGEYEFVKCTIYNNPDIEFKLASRETTFTVEENGSGYYSFRVADVPTENQEGALEEYEAHQTWETLYLIVILVIPVLFVAWLVFAIIGRKNYRKKMIAKLLFHLMLSSLGFMVCLTFTNADPSNFIIWLMGAGFPYGFFLLSYIGYKRDVARGYYVIREGEGIIIFLLRWACILFFCAVLGIVALPVTFIIDIKNICKAKK